jgi:FixJ family two-component response regulator
VTGQVNFADEPIRILCVDDEKNVLRALKRAFLDEDYEILTAESAEEALDIISREEVQLVISDYRMPGQNGVEFLREVCRRRPETVRIVLSGYADAAAIVSAINEGQIYKFIPKPWDDDELKMSIDNALERYFLHKKNSELMNELQSSNRKLQEMNENLEALVEERTIKVTMQNLALLASQNILDALPVGVVGLDLNGTIVHNNKLAKYLLNLQGQRLIGQQRDVLPPELNALIDRLHGQGSMAETIYLGAEPVKTWIEPINIGDQKGIILTLARQEIVS